MISDEIDDLTQTSVQERQPRDRDNFQNLVATLAIYDVVPLSSKIALTAVAELFLSRVKRRLRHHLAQ